MELLVLSDPLVEGLLFIDEIDFDFVCAAPCLQEPRVAPFLLELGDEAFLWHFGPNDSRLDVLPGRRILVVDLTTAAWEEGEATGPLLLPQLSLLFIAEIALKLIAWQVLVVLEAAREQVRTILNASPLLLDVLDQPTCALHLPLQLLDD